MITVKIAEEERQFDTIDEQWLNQQINRRRADGETVCVRVTIREGDIDMLLSTPTCGASVGGSRPARPHEKQVLDLWDRLNLNVASFTGGNLVAFLKQLRKVL
jgi:hypothetical protein